MDVDGLRVKRAQALANHDLAVVAEIDWYAARHGVVFEIADPPELEHAVPVLRRGPGRPRKEGTSSE